MNSRCTNLGDILLQELGVCGSINSGCCWEKSGVNSRGIQLPTGAARDDAGSLCCQVDGA